MLNSKLIEKKWSSIGTDAISGFRFVRLSPTCKPELNIGYNYEGNRCLILELPLGFVIDINPVAQENLSIDHIEENNYVVIQLIEESYFDHFNDLILSLYDRIKDIEPASEYAKEFIQSFGKWVEFFENRLKSVLSIEEIKGLYGELFVLNEFITEAKLGGTNEVLDGWVGLYDAPQDFDLPRKYVEVKAKLDSASTITISSENQLAVETGKDLHLTIVTLRTNYESGKSIYDLIQETIALIRENAGDLSILYEALRAKKITLDSLREFDNYRYSVVKSAIYDCRDEGFPGLSKLNIPNAISKLKYNLQVSQLHAFLIEERKY